MTETETHYIHICNANHQFQKKKNNLTKGRQSKEEISRRRGWGYTSIDAYTTYNELECWPGFGSRVEGAQERGSRSLEHLKEAEEEDNINICSKKTGIEVILRIRKRLAVISRLLD